MDGFASDKVVPLKVCIDGDDESIKSDKVQKWSGVIFAFRGNIPQALKPDTALSIAASNQGSIFSLLMWSRENL